jgi:tetratricopeptide (TPR) repeat protein
MAAEPLTDTERKKLDRLHQFATTSDHYRLLGTSPDAEPEKITAAYYQMSRDWHPDRHYRRELGEYRQKLELIFINITKAYKVLSDPDKRRRYNRDNKAMVALARQDMQADPQESPRTKTVEMDPETLRKRKARKAKRLSERKAAQERMSQKRGDSRQKAINKLRAQARGQNQRAKRYFDQGKSDYDAGNISKAVSSLHLAVQFDQQNKEYRALYELARSEASQSAAVQAVQSGESAESFQNYREAMHHYQRACDMDPDDGLPFYRLALLTIRVDQDKRAALGLLRSAASKSPRNVEIRLSLAELYGELGMNLNARREYQTVLRMDKSNARAKAGYRNVR